MNSGIFLKIEDCEGGGGGVILYAGSSCFWVNPVFCHKPGSMKGIYCTCIWK
jgi:hypothetical protein